MNPTITEIGDGTGGHSCRGSFLGRAGFTLIEVIVATALSSVILLIVYSAHRSIMTSIFDLTGVAEFYENASLAIQRIDRDLSYAFSHKFNERVCFIGENQMGSTANGRLDFITMDINILRPVPGMIINQNISLFCPLDQPGKPIENIGFRSTTVS